MSQPGDRVPGFEDAGDAGRARDVFARAGYTQKGVEERLAASDLFWTNPIETPASLRRTREGTPLDTLIRLFFLGEPVEEDAARRALHPMPAATWEGAGLLAFCDGDAAPLVKIIPHRGLLLAADMPKLVRAGARDDFVLGVSRSSELLAHTMIPRPAGRVLDLGTGCGVLALLASRLSERVHATDKNPRAVAFAELNARLNGVANVTCATGSLFEPVAEHRFDLIVSNPPYVISPRLRYLFCDSGKRGDEFCRELLRLSAGFLEEGGYCQVTTNWAHRQGQPWTEPLEGWFEGLGCDALVWGAQTEDASAYAMNWIQQTEPDQRARLPELYDEWMRYYDAEGIDAVTYGLVTLRRSGGHSNWARFVKVPKGSPAPAGEHVLRRFQLQDYLESLPNDGALLDETFRLAPDARVEQHYAAGERGFSVASTRLHLARDSYYTMEADPTVATLILSYRGRRRLRDVLAEMATAMTVDFDHLVPGGLAIARRLIEHGYLIPDSVEAS
jgi:SAM-dependent methyltransferase